MSKRAAATHGNDALPVWPSRVLRISPPRSRIFFQNAAFPGILRTPVPRVSIQRAITCSRPERPNCSWQVTNGRAGTDVAGGGFAVLKPIGTKTSGSRGEGSAAGLQRETSLRWLHVTGQKWIMQRIVSTVANRCAPLQISSSERYRLSFVDQDSVPGSPCASPGCSFSALLSCPLAVSGILVASFPPPFLYPPVLPSFELPFFCDISPLRPAAIQRFFLLLRLLVVPFSFSCSRSSRRKFASLFSCRSDAIIFTAAPPIPCPRTPASIIGLRSSHY